MHVYMERHVKMINKILSMFPNKQFIMTTHSPVLVGVQDHENNIDITPAVEGKYLYNILDYRMQEIKKLGKIDPAKLVKAVNLDGLFAEEIDRLKEEAVDKDELCDEELISGAGPVVAKAPPRLGYSQS